MTLRQSHQKSSVASVGRSSFQDYVFSLEKYQQKMNNADTELVWRDEPICHLV